MAMNLDETLRSRRAVRDYTHEPLDRAVIEALIAAAVLAPSAMNLQPWGFAVIEGRARLHEHGQDARRAAQAHFTAAPAIASFVADPGFDIFYGAPALIAVCARDAHQQSNEDCCLAAQNLMLAAHARGLGTCWIGLARPWLNDAATKAALGIPAEWRPVAPIIVGHRRTLPAPTPRTAASIVWCQ